VTFTVSLKENYQFKRLYAKGKKAVSPVLALYCRKNGQKRNFLGITVGTKVGKAVQRNKIRRRLREIYRLHEARFLPGYTLVVVARVRAGHTGYRELERSFLKLAGQLQLLQTPQKATGL
jgi:ribonuclease P protein component